jgi:hypothetical protein
MKRSMDDRRRFYERPDFWPRLIGGTFLFIFVIAFHSEILLALRLILAFFQLIFQRPVNPPSADTPKALIILGVNIIVYLGCYFIILKWVSLFVLPAQNSHERQQVYERLIEYISKLHGPAVFVKNGELITRKEEQGKNESARGWFASLAFVDLASAIVLESRSHPALINLSMPATSPDGHRPPIRALGPGIGFLLPGERIRGSVDLRKQFRLMKKVRGFTSDGIELETNINVIFTLGQAPEVMTVIDTKGSGFRVLDIDRDTRKIIGIVDRIDDADEREIYTNIQNQKPSRANTMAFAQFSSNRPPFIFDEDHIIAAVISQPRNTRDGKLEKWTDLPAQLAVSVLLDELSRISYDDLYSLDRPGSECYLYDRFKPEFKRKVIDLGVLSYQFVQRKDGRIPSEGDFFNADEYIFWDVSELHNSKPIRDRGIKVIEVNFSDFKPVDSTIPEQRFENWRSKWQKKTELTTAGYDLEIMRKMNHARAQAQREIIYNLSHIFKLPGYTQDAMAILVFQVLESAAANPATNRLLPRDTVDMLKNFQRLIFSRDGDGQSFDQIANSSDDRPPERPG